MDQSTIAASFHPLFEEHNEGDAFWHIKPLLAHYTTIQTVEKIICSKEIWFSNPLYMNDYQEVSFGLLETDRLLRQNSDVARILGSPENSSAFFTAYNHYRQEYIDRHLPDTYIFCLSEHSPDDHDGLLSMWRGYGGNGNGAALVFDTGQLNVVPTSPLIVAKVEYATTGQRHEWIERKLLQFSQILQQLSLPRDQLHQAAFFSFHKIQAIRIIHETQRIRRRAGMAGSLYVRA